MRSAAHPLPSGRDDTTTQQLVRAGSWMVAVTGTLIAALLLTAPVFILEMGAHLVPGMHHWIATSIGTSARRCAIRAT